MAWRFKASKYKNAAPIVPKPDACVRDICVGSYQTYGNNIAASAAFMAFNVDHNGSNLAVLPIDDCGRKSKTMPLLHAHTDTVTDMSFSPFHDGLFATGSQDCLVKLWHIPEKGLEESITQPECMFSHKQRRVETVSFHPTADFLLSSTSFSTINLWDIASEQEIYSSNGEHGDVIQCLSWQNTGSLLATTCKDKQVRIIDPRQNKVSHSANSHQGLKDSRVVWLSDTNKILTTGFDAVRLRQVFIRDIRNFEEPESVLQLDCSTGILVPLFDIDTNMLFLAGKGDTTIGYWEVVDREPYLIEGLRHSGEQTKGACLVPKRTLNVMQAEVNRVLQLTSSSVIPITYQVPRKSYRDFHGDLYPETTGPVSTLSAQQWMSGENRTVAKISLDPSKKQAGIHQVHRGSLIQLKANIKSMIITTKKEEIKQEEIKKTDIKDLKKLFNNNIKNDTPILKPVSQPKVLHTFEKTTTDNKNGTTGHAHDIIKDESPDNDNEPTVIPPKPMPRLSKGSINDSIDNGTDNGQIVPPRPAARVKSVPTTNNFNNYGNSSFKPRLGPRPYTPPKLDNEQKSESFEAVFSVPSVPENGNKQKNLPDLIEPVVEKLTLEVEKNEENEDEAHTPTTAERRKLFEQDVIMQDDTTPDKSPIDDNNIINNTDNNDDENVITSIAERRRLYESRSMSMQEPASTSPTPKRRDSLKNNHETIKEEPCERVKPMQRQNSLENKKKTELTVSAPTPKRTSTVFGQVSKFRHLKGTFMPKATHIENIRNISQQLAKECDGFHANPLRVAVPLSGAGGRIAVFELNKTGKLPDGVIPTLVNGTNIMDFAWDPFDYSRLAVACDDGTIKLWHIPDNGLTEPTNEPNKVLSGHAEKIFFLKFHPLARDVIATGSYDMTIRIWDLKQEKEMLQLEGHPDQIFSFAWSPCGKYCATMCKDNKLRVFEPRKSSTPINEGLGTEGIRGARVVWALDGTRIIVAGFDKISERQIVVYNWKNLKSPLATVGLDVSPAILVPFYDEDSSTLFLTGKGDSTVYCYEVSDESPYLCPLSHQRLDTVHQGLSFLPKNVCNVAIVEFAKALRLTNNTIKPVSYTVPRIKSELFQDDLFPPTKVTWEPTMEASEWFSGLNKPAKRVSLKPEGMESLSESQGNNGTPEKTVAKNDNNIINNSHVWSGDRECVKAKQAEIQKSVSSMMEVNMKLEQDTMEGVDDKEWDE